MPFIPTVSLLTSVYQGEDYLSSFFEQVQTQTIFPELELVLVMNEPSSKEKQLANDFAVRNPAALQVLTVPLRETLGASWNRAWRASRSPYLVLWNVDDRRVIDSLQRQLATLEQNPAAVLSYGDYVTVPAYGREEGVRRHTQAYHTGHFRRAFAQGGAFWLFRREVADQVGYFDEQFQVGADLEYSFRLAAKGLQMTRCEGLLGYFTDASQGLSTREGAIVAAVERTVTQLRYGVFDKVRKDYLDEARKMRLDAVKNAETWIPLGDYLPEHASYVERRKWLWLVGRMRNAVRNGLQSIGLLPLLYRAQEKHLKRDI
ncbi:MAG TPA: glycosyltransferase [Anaerolineales bacterium]|nr:glycosyltransferase [Anaerolineales bacterium]